MTGIFSGSAAAFGYVLTLFGGHALAADRPASILIWCGLVLIAVSQGLAYMAGREAD